MCVLKLKAGPSVQYCTDMVCCTGMMETKTALVKNTMWFPASVIKLTIPPTGLYPQRKIIWLSLACYDNHNIHSLYWHALVCDCQNCMFLYGMSDYAFLWLCNEIMKMLNMAPFIYHNCCLKFIWITLIGTLDQGFSTGGSRTPGVLLRGIGGTQDD